MFELSFWNFINVLFNSLFGHFLSSEGSHNKILYECLDSFDWNMNEMYPKNEETFFLY